MYESDPGIFKEGARKVKAHAISYERMIIIFNLIWTFVTIFPFHNIFFTLLADFHHSLHPLGLGSPYYSELISGDTASAKVSQSETCLSHVLFRLLDISTSFTNNCNRATS